MSFDQKHSPKTLDEVMFNNPADRKRIQQYASGERWHNLLLYGPKGTAKSTTARLICEASCVKAPVYHASNCSDKIPTAMTNEFNWLRLEGAKTPYIVIEEVDQLPRTTQHKLRGFMDDCQRYGRFILTTNNRHLIDQPLVDRCDDIEFFAPNIDLMMERAKTILTAEGKHCDEDTLRMLLAAGDGSLRRMLRNIEDLVLS